MNIKVSPSGSIMDGPTQHQLEELNTLLKKHFEYPSTTNNENLSVETTQPLFKITGLDANGNVQLKTGTEVKLQKGDKIISLQKEHLQGVLEKSQQITDTIKNLDDEETDSRVKKMLEIYSSMEKQPAVNVSSVNKNAYEIRLEILRYAIDWAIAKGIEKTVEDDYVINLANKFYRFVENKRY